MKHLITQFSPCSSEKKYSPHYLALEHPQFMFFPYGETPNMTPIENNG